MRSRLALLVLLSALALTACGNGGDGGGAGGSAADSPSPTVTSESTESTESTEPTEPTEPGTPVEDDPQTASPLPTLTPPTAPPSTPSDAFQEATVSGTVTLNGDCTTLTDENGVVWDLRGDLVADLGSGELVTVTGRSQDDPANRCPGAPLHVTRLG